MQHDMSKIIVQLFTEEPFFASVMLDVRRRASEEITTAGVRYDEHSGKFELIYNPVFISGMQTSEAVAVFLHEMLHIVLQHVTGRSAPIKSHGLKAWNYATDLAINSHLAERLPKRVITKDGEMKDFHFIIPGVVGGPFEHYPLFQSAEWYLEALMKDPNIEKKMVASDMVGDHSGWEECKEPSAMEKAELKRVMQKAKQRAQSHSWGSVPQAMREYIEQLLQPQIDWKAALRYFVAQSQRGEKYSTFKKYNRRYPYQHPGRRTNKVASIAISIDQSGSVDDGLLSKFFGELNSLSNIASFDVVPFDYVVHEDKVFTWKKGQKKRTERVAHGGTNFDAPTHYVNERKQYDAHIILTDMGAPVPGYSRVPRMWITEKRYENSTKEFPKSDAYLFIS